MRSTSTSNRSRSWSSAAAPRKSRPGDGTSRAPIRRAGWSSPFPRTRRGCRKHSRASARVTGRSPTDAAVPCVPSRSTRSTRSGSARDRLEFPEPGIVGVVARQQIAELDPLGALVVEHVALRATVDRPRYGRPRDVDLAGADRGRKKERRSAGGTESAAALRRRPVPNRPRRSRQEAEAILRGPDPAHECRAVGFPAPAAVTVREEQRRLLDREAHRATEAAALELAHG